MTVIIEIMLHFRCFMCHKPFKSFHNLRKHFRSHDPKKCWKYGCQICDKELANKKTLKSHIKTVHEGKRKPRYEKYYQDTTCPICDKT